MNNQQQRDVTGGHTFWAGIIPGLGLVNFILGWISIPAETFLRRDFGENYYSRANFIAGLIVLICLSMMGSLLDYVGNLPFIGAIFRHGDEVKKTASWLGTVIKLYMLVGIGHFVTMWVRTVIRKPILSTSSGRSWLTPIGRILIGFMNLPLNGLVHLVAQLVPKHREAILSVQPVLRNADRFTERFVEPFFLFIVALFCAAAGQTGMFWWLMLSITALNLYTGMRHKAERGYELAIQDGFLLDGMYRNVSEGKNAPDSVQSMVNSFARAADMNPGVVETIRAQSPSLADAVAAMQKKRKQKQSDAHTGATEMATAV